MFFINIGSLSYSRAQTKNAQPQKTERSKFERPEPTRPVQAEVPSVNRYQQDKIFLEYADSLYKPFQRNDTFQILKGDVKFRQAGMWMYCDSSYYYPNDNSLDAFGHVRMEQGDTLFVYADKLFYNGNTRLARLKNGQSEPKVRLINKNVTLTTDSLDYDLANEVGWYSRWGTLDDKTNTLTSLIGYYYPDLKEAEFYKDVVLVNNADGYTLLTDTLFYNTNTHIARIESLATIQGKNDTIVTRKAVYNTESGDADLLSRSMIIHRDSTGNVTTMEGDSIVYNKLTHISKAYMYRNPVKHPRPMELNDTAHKTSLIGGFGIFNDSTQEAVAYHYPLLIEYSGKDTLFLRADTIRTFLLSEWVKQEAPKKKIEESPVVDGRPIVVVDSTGIYFDEIFFALQPPLLNYPLQLLEAALPPPAITEEFIDSGIETAHPLPNSPVPFENTPLHGSEDSLQELDEGLQPDSGDEFTEIINSEEVLPVIIEETDFALDSLLTDKKDLAQDSLLVKREYHVALAYPYGRFFKKDIQGVADTLLVVEKDSMLYMFKKPVVWSGERQVAGNRIDVHFNDSTADWAQLPESGLMAEHIEEDFFNQIAGKLLFATFANQTLKTLNVNGNVETIFLPQESDSTYNRLVFAESSFLTLDMDSGKMEKLKMWPEVNGSVTPLFLVRNNQKHLRNFKWLEWLRPVREWYGGRIIWADDLGEVPDVLKSYLSSPSDFGEPKTGLEDVVILPKEFLRDYDDREAVEELEETLEGESPGELENDEIFDMELNRESEELEESIETALEESEENNNSYKANDSEDIDNDGSEDLDSLESEKNKDSLNEENPANELKEEEINPGENSDE